MSGGCRQNYRQKALHRNPEERRLLRELHDYAAYPDDSSEKTSLPRCIHTGTAGVGLELLHPPDATSRNIAAHLFRHVIHTIDQVGSPKPRLMFGSTGTAVALAAYIAATGSDPGPIESEQLLDATARMAPPDTAHLPVGEQVSDAYVPGPVAKPELARDPQRGTGLIRTRRRSSTHGFAGAVLGE